MKNKLQGFSLIELMIVVAIVGIIAAVAYPSFMEQVRKSRRSDGITMINTVIKAQERHFVNELTYSVDLTDMGFASANDVDSQEGYYKVSAATCAGGLAIDRCVKVTAVAQGSQVSDGDLSLNTRGQKEGNW